jgi:hypothetical protein
MRTETSAPCKNCSSRGGGYKYYCLLGLDAVQSSTYLSTFQRNLLPPYLGKKRVVPEDVRNRFLRNLGFSVIDQNTVIFIVNREL